MRIALVLLMATAVYGQRYTATETTENGVRYIVLADHKKGVEAWISPEHGGELSGLRVAFQGKPVELIYRARDYSKTPGWTGRAPLLWPATGRNFAQGAKPDGLATECSYDWKGKRYDIPIHGFVRNMPWKVHEKSASGTKTHTILSLRDTPQTLASYPFHFQFQAEYTVSDGRLSIAYTVQSDSRNTDAMFFSIGNHITFRTPFLEGSRAEDMTFLSPSSVEYLKDAANVPTGKQVARSFARAVKLGDLTADPAVSLGGYRDDPYVILVDPAGLAVKLSHRAETWPDAPVVQFNVWGDAKAGYFSPEPWAGIQNSFNLRQALISLAQGQKWTWTIDLEVSSSDAAP